LFLGFPHVQFEIDGPILGPSARETSSESTGRIIVRLLHFGRKDVTEVCPMFLLKPSVHRTSVCVCVWFGGGRVTKLHVCLVGGRQGDETSRKLFCSFKTSIVHTSTLLCQYSANSVSSRNVTINYLIVTLCNLVGSYQFSKHTVLVFGVHATSKMELAGSFEILVSTYRH